MNRRIGMGGAVALGLSVLLAAPAAQADDAVASPSAATIHVPGDFVSSLSDTRINGHRELVGTGLHVWTDGDKDTVPNTTISSDKVAEYVAAAPDTTLASVGEPTLDFTNTSGGGVPGFQLYVDFDADGTTDGILIGEPTVPGYGNDWWLNNAAAQEYKNAAPSHIAGYGSENHGTLDAWRSAFPNAKVTAFGFSLGSGVKGDGIINAINFADSRYTFAADPVTPEPVILHSKDQCKNGGWAKSTDPVYKNQGECVSHFATNSNNGNVVAGANTGKSTTTTVQNKGRMIAI